LDEIKESLKELKGIYSICVYGSAARGDFIPGWSDVDLLIVFDYNFVVPRECYESAISWYSKTNSEIQKKYNSRVKAYLYDKANLAYGRFCFMQEDFKTHLRESSKTLYGKDMRDILPQIFPIGLEEKIAYSLWTTRKNIITLNYNNHKELQEGVQSCMGGFKNFLRNVCYLKDGKLNGDSNAAIVEQFFSSFPQISENEVEKLLNATKEWESLKNNEKILKELLFSSLNLRERVIELMSESKLPGILYNIRMLTKNLKGYLFLKNKAFKRE
jgi:hypothetical protein